MSRIRIWRMVLAGIMSAINGLWCHHKTAQNAFPLNCKQQFTKKLSPTSSRCQRLKLGFSCLNFWVKCNILKCKGHLRFASVSLLEQGSLSFPFCQKSNFAAFWWFSHSYPVLALSSFIHSCHLCLVIYKKQLQFLIDRIIMPLVT